MRISSFTLAAALVCVPATALAETPLQKETAIWQAFKEKKASSFSAMFAPNYVGLYEDGTATRAKELENLEGSKVESFKIDDFASRMIGPNDMLTTYVVNVKGSMGKQDVSGRYHAASLWHRSGATWLTTYHSEIKAK